MAWLFPRHELSVVTKLASPMPATDALSPAARNVRSKHLAQSGPAAAGQTQAFSCCSDA